MFKRRKYFIYYYLIYVIIILIKDCESLKSLKIHVPDIAKSGDVVTLICEYDLEEAALYTIKWYRNEIEFYRYVPKESPPSKAFSVPHINVDISRSGPKKVTLRSIRRELTGIYKCEVSADAPLFHTDMKSAQMIVADVPDVDPVLDIEPMKVEIGKTIIANCYTLGSNPAANITWYVNYEKILSSNNEIKLYKTQHDTDKALGLHSSHSRIEIIANRSLFLINPLVIRCEANIYKLWNRIIDGHVSEDTSTVLVPVLGSTSSQRQINTFDLVENSTVICEKSFNLILLCLYLFARRTF